jgi:hypothetical protein
MPDRDAFVLAWGDAVLTGLRPRTRMLYNVGHFVSAENGTAEFALPNAFHVQMAEPHREEVAAALSAHFGVPVEIRLVLERGPRQTPSGGPKGDEPPDVTGTNGSEAPPPSPDTADTGGADELAEEIDETAVTGGSQQGTDWAAERIRAAFPGVEEVDP